MHINESLWQDKIPGEANCRFCNTINLGPRLHGASFRSAFHFHDISVLASPKLKALENGFQSVIFKNRNRFTSCVNCQSGEPENVVMS